jgi:LDH2 family malate/lactate/ureidoglycolate dehydrogenase
MPLEQDMIGIVLAREGPVCAPWGGTMPVTGTNPLSVAIPAGKAYPIVLDFATTVVSQGQVKSTLLQDRAIPEGWLIDRRGKSVKGYDLTLEEFEAFWNEKRGSLLPFGTYKGYGINVAIDVLCGALNLTGTGARAKGQGVLSLVINVGAFNPARDFKDEVDHLIDEIKSSPVRPGYDEVLLPGEREFRVLERRRKEGLPVDEKSWQEIKDTCSDLGVEPDHIMQGT